jgi:hypothetical protein
MAEETTGVATFDERELRDSWKFLTGYLVACIALLVVTTVVGLGGLGVVVVGPCLLWAATRLLRRPVRLRISRDGIVDHTHLFSPGLVPWDRIVDVTPTRWGMIDIEIRDEAEFFQRASPLGRLVMGFHRVLGLGPCLLPPWLLGMSRRHLVDVIESGMDHFALTQARRMRSIGAGEREAEEPDL